MDTVTRKRKKMSIVVALFSVITLTIVAVAAISLRRYMTWSILDISGGPAIWVECEGPEVIKKPLLPAEQNRCPYLKVRDTLRRVMLVEYDDIKEGSGVIRYHGDYRNDLKEFRRSLDTYKDGVWSEYRSPWSGSWFPSVRDPAEVRLTVMQIKVGIGFNQDKEYLEVYHRHEIDSIKLRKAMESCVNPAACRSVLIK